MEADVLTVLETVTLLPNTFTLAVAKQTFLPFVPHPWFIG